MPDTYSPFASAQAPQNGLFLQGLLQALSAALSPQEAEAKVTPKDVPSSEAVTSMVEQSSPGIDNFKKLLYSVILQKAQNEEQNVDVSQKRVLGGIGEYSPEQNYINLSQSYYTGVPSGNPAMQNTLAHELLHYLMTQYGKQYRAAPTQDYETRGLSSIGSSTPLQHDVIRYILGNDKAPEFSPHAYLSIRPLQQGAIPQGTRSWPPFNAALTEIVRRLFQGTSLQQGVMQEQQR